MQQYADAKTDVITSIMGRAQDAPPIRDGARHEADASAG
jgi:hypothetical protein